MTLPWFTVLSPNIYRLPKTAEGNVILTFDDGPHPTVTPLILDILDQHRVKACFFCIGENARKYPHIVKEIADRGHVVANHTERHRVLPLMSLRQAKAEMHEGFLSLQQCAPTSRYIRFPKGYRSIFVDRLAKKLGFTPVGFSYPAYDVENPPAEQIIRTIANKVSSRDILLFHDGCAPDKPGERSSLVTALPKIIETILYQKKLHIRPISEVL